MPKPQRSNTENGGGTRVQKWKIYDSENHADRSGRADRAGGGRFARRPPSIGAAGTV